MATHIDNSGRSGARRRRPYLISLTVAAVSLGLLSLAGVFAQATDRATTGTNTYETPGLSEAPDIDLQLAAHDGQTCGEFSDDLVTGLFDVVEGQTPPTDATSHVREMCVRNVGSESGSLVMSAIDLVDVDLDCTGREQEVDVTCGGEQDGELSQFLRTRVEMGSNSTDTELSSWAADAFHVGDLESGETQVMTVTIPETSNTQLDTLQHRLIQSDRSSWRFQLDLVSNVAPPPPACDQLDPEPNNSAAEAVVYGDPLQGSICAGDEDWYAFNVGSSPGVLNDVEISLTFTHAEAPGGDLDLELYNSSGVLVATSDSLDDDELIVQTIESGLYHIRVFEYLGGMNPLYGLSASWSTFQG